MSEDDDIPMDGGSADWNPRPVNPKRSMRFSIHTDDLRITEVDRLVPMMTLGNFFLLPKMGAK